MSTPAGAFTISIDQVQEYEFRVTFDKPELQPLVVDEPPPLGRGAGPNPSRLLASATGACLCASLLFCLQKARIPVQGLHAEVTVQSVRNERGRLRIGSMSVKIKPQLSEEDKERARRCADLFEDFCVVTQSVRQGIPVEIVVEGLEES